MRVEQTDSRTEKESENQGIKGKTWEGPVEFNFSLTDGYFPGWRGRPFLSGLKNGFPGIGLVDDYLLPLHLHRILGQRTHIHADLHLSKEGVIDSPSAPSR